MWQWRVRETKWHLVNIIHVLEIISIEREFRCKHSCRRQTICYTQRSLRCIPVLCKCTFSPSLSPSLCLSLIVPLFLADRGSRCVWMCLNYRWQCLLIDRVNAYTCAKLHLFIRFSFDYIWQQLVQFNRWNWCALEVHYMSVQCLMHQIFYWSFRSIFGKWQIRLPF